MSTKKGWKIKEYMSIPVTISADVSEGQVGKLTAENTGAIALKYGLIIFAGENYHGTYNSN